MKIADIATRIAEHCARHPWVVLGLALALSLPALWASAHLPVLTSRHALLPQDTPVAERLNRFLTEFGAASDLIVVVEDAPRADLETFASELAGRLRLQPEVAAASERVDRRFLLDHAYLTVPQPQLQQLQSLLSAVAAEPPPQDERGLNAMLGKALTWLERPPALGHTDLESARRGLAAASWMLGEWQRWLSAPDAPLQLDAQPLLTRFGAEDLAREYFASRDGRMLFIFVHPADASSDFERRAPFVQKVRAMADELAAARKAAGQPVPKVGLTGLPAIEYEEYVDVQRDIVFVVSTAAVAIAVLILVVVRSVRWALAIFVPMGFGALWGLGLALFTVGHLTIITSGFLAILFGLGADYGIFTSSRIAEERRSGRPLVAAIGRGIGASFLAVLTSGGASVVIFAALATVDFPGFAELGRVAAGGVLLILLSTWMVQPALYALFPPKLSEPHLTDHPQRFGWPLRGALPSPLAALVAMVAIGAALFGAFKAREIPFDYDVLALLPRDSEAAYYQRRMVTESEYQAEVIIFTAPDLAEARRISEAAGRLGSIAKVQSLTALFPPDAEARSALARTIGSDAANARLAARLLALDRLGLPVSGFERLRQLVHESTRVVDDFQEQAFAAGHTDLVEGLEQIRTQLAAIERAMTENPERGRQRSEQFFRTLIGLAERGAVLIEGWRNAAPLNPRDLPDALRHRFFSPEGTIAVYAFPRETVYRRENLVRLTQEVYGVSPEATGFPTTHLDFSDTVVAGFQQGTLLALAACLVFLLLILRSLPGFLLAALPLLIGGGWMLGILYLWGIHYNYANIIALPLVMALAVDYGVWFSHRWRELTTRTPLEISLIAGRVIVLAAGTELAGLGAITLARYRGVAGLGIDITIGLLCCLPATLLVGPAIGQLIDRRTPSP